MRPCFPATSVAALPTREMFSFPRLVASLGPQTWLPSPALLRVPALLSDPDSAFLPLPSLCGIWGLLEVGTCSQLALCFSPLLPESAQHPWFHHLLRSLSELLGPIACRPDLFLVCNLSRACSAFSPRTLPSLSDFFTSSLLASSSLPERESVSRTQPCFP